MDDEDLQTGVLATGAWRDAPSLMFPIDRLYYSNNYGRTGEQVRQFYMHFTTHILVSWKMKSIGTLINDYLAVENEECSKNK